MKIMVFDVAAESGGAISILNEFYNQFKNDPNEENIYYLILSVADLKAASNIMILNFRWLKKSWFHRLYFDNVIAPKLVREYHIDEVLSLQNICVPHIKVRQTLYVHNAIPFSKYKFSFLRQPKLWVYKNLIGLQIFKSIKAADRVIVQTHWMKEKCIEKTLIDSEKVEVKFPILNIKSESRCARGKDDEVIFFYPASGVEFKNHRTIIGASLLLKEKKINNYKIVFTIHGDENKHCRRLKKIVEKHQLPIQFIGTIKHENMEHYYRKSMLLFPSYLETIGLPLLEARAYKCTIIVSNCTYAREILEGYEKVDFFDPFDTYQLQKILDKHIT